jgi:hypothetical protein
MYSLSKLTLSEVTRLGSSLRTSGASAAHMEAASQAIVKGLYDGLEDGLGSRAVALARLYKTQEYAHLDSGLQGFARGILGSTPEPELRCLTLLATAGDEAAWNTREASKGHQAIPLPSESAVERLPMVMQLVQQLGIDVRLVVRPESKLMLDMEQKTFNVFHVERALGSPFIPAQDFVRSHSIASVLGFGGLLPSGDMFAIVMFTKVSVSREIADLFKPIALNVKLALLPFGNRVFS